MLPLNRKKIAKRKVSREDSAQTADDFHEDDYSTVGDCSRILPANGASGEPDRPSRMVECELYALEGATKAPMPDISPYACFYGASGPPVLKVGWLDKLSPQG